MKFVRLAAWCLATLLSSAALASWWLRHPDVIPRLPEKFWIWLADLYGVQNGEQLADLEILVISGFSVLVVVAVLTIGAWMWPQVRRSAPSRRA